MGLSHIKKQGFSIVEILIAMVVFAIFSTGTLYLSIDTLQRNGKLETNNEAILYAQEGLEAARNIRDRSFLDLGTGSYGLALTDDTWTLIVAPESIDNYYSRTITIADVFRNVDGDIAETGTLDPEIKRVTSEITWTWKGILPMSTSLTTYLTGWRSDEWLQTTCTEFDQGTYDGTDQIAAPSPPEDNCSMQLGLSEELSSFFSSVNVGSHGDDVVVSNNYAYLAAAKSTQGLVISNIEDRNNPEVESTLDIKGKGRYVTKDDNYVFAGVESSSKGLAIVDVSDPENPSLEKSYDLGAYGNQPAVDGNYLYMGVEDNSNSFVVFDISSPINPTEVATVDFGASTNVIDISGDYAYVGTTHGSESLKVVDISDPENPAEAGGLNIGANILAVETHAGAFAFVGTANATNSLNVVNITDPENPTLLFTLATDGAIQDIAISGSYLYATTNDEGIGLNIFNIANPLTPYLAYSTDIGGKGTGAYTDEVGYVYMGMNVNNKGLVIMETMMPAYETYGEYISDVLDTESDTTRYDFIEWEASEVVGGTLKFQIRTASTESGLTTATWVGSDGTNSTYYETSRTIIETDPSKSGVRYFQFKAIMTSDSVETPNIESITIKYIP